MSKKVFKYATGDEIPEGAVYLTTVVQTEIIKGTGNPHVGNYKDEVWLVWHYFLVEDTNEPTS